MEWVLVDCPVERPGQGADYMTSSNELIYRNFAWWSKGAMNLAELLDRNASQMLLALPRDAPRCQIQDTFGIALRV